MARARITQNNVKNNVTSNLIIRENLFNKQVYGSSMFDTSVLKVSMLA